MDRVLLGCADLLDTDARVTSIPNFLNFLICVFDASNNSNITLLLLYKIF